MTAHVQTIHPSQISRYNSPKSSLLFERFSILSTIAKGDLNLFKARDMVTNRVVALKVLRRSSGQDDATWHRLCQRLDQEVACTQMAQGPNVLVFEGYYQNEDTRCLALEFLDGVTLRHWLRYRTPTSEQFIYILRELCKALQPIHEQGFIHRDLKPENVMLTRDNRVVLIDFGIAFDVALDVKRVEPGIVRGTPGYLAPEQLRCKALSIETDLYALGAIMCEMMIGRPLFPGKDIDSILKAQIRHAVPSLRDYVQDTNVDTWKRIVRVTRRCLRRRSSARYKDILELWSALSTHELFPLSTLGELPN